MLHVQVFKEFRDCTGFQRGSRVTSCMLRDSIGRELVQSVATASADVTGIL